VAVIEIAIWFLIFLVTRTASIGSMVILVITVPLLIWQGVTGLALVWVGLMIALVVWRHRGNIQRMVSGSEEKVPT
jgi:glycerol-3-phosphate acyltransferase PlsY